MATYFTSDTHFGHGGALGLFKRPFGSVAEMDAALIERWNETVDPGDTVWHLGDFGVGLKDNRAHEILSALAGTKHLIAGNKDDDAVRALPGWASVRDYHEMTLDEERLRLIHYPLRSWRGDKKGAWNIHGHSHGHFERSAPLRRQRDAGVDVWDFRPVTLATLTARRKPRRKSAEADGAG